MEFVLGMVVGAALLFFGVLAGYAVTDRTAKDLVQELVAAGEALSDLGDRDPNVTR